MLIFASSFSDKWWSNWINEIVINKKNQFEKERIPEIEIEIAFNMKLNKKSILKFSILLGKRRQLYNLNFPRSQYSLCSCFVILLWTFEFEHCALSTHAFVKCVVIKSLKSFEKFNKFYTLKNMSTTSMHSG